MKHGMSKLEVAKALGLSRVRVGQIERKALRKLKNSGKLEKFLCLLDVEVQEYYGDKHRIIKQCE